MIKRLSIKYYVGTALVGFGVVLSCQRQIIPELISDPSAHNMKIIPSSPISEDEIKP
jgi:hypothetical protein